MLSIALLGNPTVLLDGAPVRGFVSGKAAALIYYLATTGRAHTRESLAGLLWPEVIDAQASKNLRDVLSNLRRLLGQHLDATRQTVALVLGEHVLVDSRRFEEDLAAGMKAGGVRLRDAVSHYTGDFLEGFSLADTPTFEEWALVERERLRWLLLTGLQRLAGDAAHQGSYQEGIGYASRLLALDPTREEAHRQLMLLLALGGQRSAALAQYTACRRILDDELGIDPDEATEALHRRILAGEVAGPPAGSVRAAPIQPLYQLPATLTGLIGRAAEADQVVSLLSDHSCRLVTITGPGGAGKTSLALHAAHRLATASRRGEVFAHGLAFVALALVEQAALPAMAARVADALGFTFSGAEPPLDQLAGSLRAKELLLVLDNCEQLPVSDFTVALLERAPGLKILATSRGRLSVRGEQIVALGGLPFPSSDKAGQKALERYDAVQLFRRTAQAASPHLTWTSEDAAAAARICRLVAGLPLGIELAASLARLMPIDEIAREIAANLEFLQGSRRDLPERHQSLRAVFDHSWRLLQPDEQRALSQLSVFRGGFGREAAARVAGATLPILGALLDNSLVRQSANRGQPTGRYDLLELVHQYAAEQLAEAQRRDGAAQGQAFDRHGRYYLDLLSARRDDLRGTRQLEAAGEIRREIENVRAAWRWALEYGHVELIGRATESLFFFYEMRSMFPEGAEAFGQAAARVAEIRAVSSEPLVQIVAGRLLAYEGWCAFQIGQHAEAQTLLGRSLEILRPLDIAADLVVPLNYLAALAYYSGDYAEAEQIVAEALRASRACGSRHGAAVSLTILGQIATLVGCYEDARRYSEESLAIERELGNRWGMVFPLISLGRVALALGAYQEALGYFQEGLAIRQTFDDTRGVALCLRYLGETAKAMGEYPEAGWFFHEALALFQAIGNQAGIVMALAELGYSALAQHERATAASHFHRALQVAWQTQSTPRILEALVGIATASVDEEPRRAYELGVFVRDHIASTQESRDRAAALIARLAPEDAPSAAPGDLEAVVGLLLGEDRGPHGIIDYVTRV